MEITAFAIWKFKTVEGKLKNVLGWNFETTRFELTKPLATECYHLKYDYVNEKATLINYNFMLELSAELETVPFSEVPKMLKKYGLYNVAPLNERHTSSYSADEK